MPAADPFALAGAAPAGWAPGMPPPAPPAPTAASGGVQGAAPITTITVTAKAPAGGSAKPDDPFAMAGAAPAGWAPPQQSPAVQQQPAPGQPSAATPGQPSSPGFWQNLANGAGAALTGVANGAVGGRTVDYAAAGLGTPWRMLTTGEGVGPAFHAQLAQEEGADDQSAKQYPVETIGGNLAGGLETGLRMAPYLGYQAAAGFVPKVGAAASYLARNAGFGGAMAALNGQDPTTGAAIGGGIAAALPAAGMALKPLRWIYGQLAPILSEGAQQTSVARNLERTGITPGQITASPVGPLDLAQATNSPAIAAKVRFAQGVAPDAASDLRAQQVQAVRDHVAQMAQEASPGEASSQLVNAVRGASDAAREQERGLWNAPALKQTQVQTQWLKGTLQQAVKNLDPGLRLGVTGPIKAALDQLAAMPKTASVSDLNSVRTAFRLAGKPSESNPWAGPVSKQLQDAFMDGLDRTLSASTVPDDVRAAYDAARTFTRQRAQAFGSQDLRAIRAKNPDGAFTVDPSEGGRRFFNFGNASPEGPKNIADLANFVSGLRHQHAGLLSGQLRGAARSYVAAALTKAAKIGEDQAFNPNAMVRFLDQNRGWMASSGLFTKPQLEAADRLLEYGRMLGRTENLRVAKNSTTNEKGETAKTFIDQIMSPWMKRGLSVAGVLGGLHAEGGMGAVVGGLAGHGAADMTAHAETAMRELMAEALHNPRVAQDLLMKASAGNARLLSAPTRRLIEGIRVAGEAGAARDQ